MKAMKFLFAAGAALFLSLGAFAAPVTAKAVFSVDHKTMTFVYTAGIPLGVDSYSITADASRGEGDVPAWHEHASSVTKVVFDSTFASVSPTRCDRWFADFENLETIEGIVNLKTGSVTDMTAMFSGCSKLKLLKVNGFDMANVDEMAEMFKGCSSLRRIIGPFKTGLKSGAESASMFEGCTSLVGGFGTAYDPANIGKSCARIDLAGAPGYFCYPAVAHYDASAKKLTFYNDNLMHMIESGDVVYSVIEEEVEDPSGDRSWADHAVDITEVVFHAQFVNFKPLHCAKWFADFSELTTVTGIANLDTSLVEDMQSMFYNCTKLAALDVAGFETGRVKSMRGMFEWCEKLTTLNVGGFDTSAVTDLSYMFAGCSELTTLDVSSFDSLSVQNMEYMFSGCEKLTALEVSQFDTRNVEYMGYMFVGCVALTELDLSGFETRKVKDMEGLFNGCTGLRTIYVSDGFSTAGLENEYEMFTDCTSLVGGNGTAYAYGQVFPSCARIDRAGRPGYFTATAVAVLSTDGETLTFYADGSTHAGEGLVYSVIAAGNIDPADDPPWHTGLQEDVATVVFDPSFVAFKPKHCGSWFYEFSSLTNVVGMQYLDVSEATSLAYMFSCCSKIPALDLSGFKTANVTDMRFMFEYCEKLETIVASSDFVTTGVTGEGRKGLFTACSKLVGGMGTSFAVAGDMTADYARADRASVGGAAGYFTVPYPLAVLSTDGKTLRFVCDLGDYSAYTRYAVEGQGLSDDPAWSANCKDVVTKVVFDRSFARFRPPHCRFWFNDFAQLTEVVGLEYLDVSQATVLTSMFRGCSLLRVLDLTSFDTAHATTIGNMFAGCQALETIYATDRFVANAPTESAFFNCARLRGGNGTCYTDYTMIEARKADKAQIDRAGHPGYFTLKSSATVGHYVSLDLERNLGVRIDADYLNGDKVTVKAEGLAKGLKLVATPTYVDPKAKKKVIQDCTYTIEGVPTETIDFATRPMFARVTVTHADKTKEETLQPLQLTIAPAEVLELPDGWLTTAYLTNIKDLWPEADENWKITGQPSGLGYAAKLVTKKNKDKSVTTNALPFEIYGKPTKAGVFTITASHVKLVGKTKYTETETATMTVWGDDGATKFRYTNQAYVPMADKVFDATYKGFGNLPTGLKYTTKAIAANPKKGTPAYAAYSIYGLPSKAGVYAVTATKVDPLNPKKTIKETFLWEITPGENGGILPVVESPFQGSAVTVKQGVLQDGLNIPVTAGAKVSQSGLPAGLKLVQDANTKKWSVQGTPTTVGNFIVTLTSTVNGLAVSERISIIVEPNEWTGTWYAVQSDSDVGTTINAVVTVSPNGTVKLVLTEGSGTKLTKTTVSTKTINADGRTALLEVFNKSKVVTRTFGVNFANGRLKAGSEWAADLCATVTPSGYDVTTFTLEENISSTLHEYAYVTATYNAKTKAYALAGKLWDGTAIKGTTYAIDKATSSLGHYLAPILLQDKSKNAVSIELSDDGSYARVIKNGTKLKIGLDPSGTVPYSKGFAAAELKGRLFNESYNPKAKSGSGMVWQEWLSVAADGGNVMHHIPENKLSISISAQGLMKYTFTDDDGWKWACEMLAIDNGGSIQFRGIATGTKKGASTQYCLVWSH